jgi:CheY-like chemotaxis protein
MSGDERLRILVVEDEVLIALELEDQLRGEGHCVVGVASTSTEAARLGREERPCLALVDIHLADGPTGLSVAETLSSQGVAVVFMSANTRKIPPDFAGAIGAIGKPYSERGVHKALRFLTRWLRGETLGPAPDPLVLSVRAPEILRALSRGSAHDRTACDSIG